jgi:anti-sigma factor RsiW
MSCGRYRRDLSDRRDGVLSARRRVRLEAHLAVCPECRAYESDLDRLERHLPREPEAGLTPGRGQDFLRRLRARIEAEGPSPAGTAGPFWRRWWAWGPAGATVAAAALLAWFFLARPVPSAEVYFLSESDAFSRIYFEYAQSPQLAEDFDAVVQASIDEALAEGDEGLALNPFDDPFLAEGASDSELGMLGQDAPTDTPL